MQALPGRSCSPSPAGSSSNSRSSVRSEPCKRLDRRMRLLALFLLLAVAGCDAPDDHFKLITVESPDNMGLSLRELPPSTLSSIGLGYGLAVIKLGITAERA